MCLGEYNGNRYELLDKGAKKASDINHQLIWLISGI